MSSHVRCALSVILPFGDDEDVIGDSVRGAVELLRDTGMNYEIIAVDEDSGDNSHAVLAMMRRDVADLRVISASARLRGVEAGVARAQGQALAVLAPSKRLHTEGLLDAISRVRFDGVDIEIQLGRFLAANRVRAYDAFEHARLSGEALQKKFAKRAANRGLNVIVDGVRQTMTPPTPMARLRDAFGMRRAS